LDEEMPPEKPAVEVVFHPVVAQRRTRKNEKRAVIAELHGRSVDLNKGGSRGITLVTAYRENAIQIACWLEANGPSSPACLRESGTGAKTLPILADNFYGWFERVKRGVYALSSKGREEIGAYPELVAHYREMIERAGPREE
jgi:hypothetical protein